MTSHTEHPKPARERMRVDLGVAYGLIGGAAAGSLLMALTGDVLWVSIGPSLGLLLGLAIAALVGGRGADDDRS